MWLLLVIAGIFAVAAFGWWFLFQAPVPEKSGTLVAEGLERPVEVIRDRFGIPHIFAQSVEDAAYALGWVHVQDRWWQLELNRRVSSGRLAEALGKVALPADRFLRRIGLRRAAAAESAALEPEERRVLEAYARGINAAMKATPRPLEMRLLGIRPEPWTATDTLAFAKMMALNLCCNFEGELFRARLIEKVGPERARLFELSYPAGQPTVVPPGAPAAESAAELARLYAQVKELMPLGGAGASNNWVVDGRRTQSGRPLLANDPHLLLSLPSIWYEAHLVAPGLDVYGAALVGAPGVVLGHNRRVAWGFTNSNADVQDLYIERFREDGAYEFKGQWLRPERVSEVIKVKGHPDEIEEVLITCHGPVLIGPEPLRPALSLKWAAHEPGHMVSALLAMARARSAAELREALRKWHTPSQNVVFADVDGNIGYVMAGVVPIRAKGSGFSPVPGWTGEYEWIGSVPFEELPQAFNPECGYLVTANNRVVNHDYKHHISWDYLNGFRAHRIESLLTAKEKLTAKDFRDIQMDVHCAPGREFAELCRALSPTDAFEKRALEKLTAWDGQASADSVGATVYEATLLASIRAAFEPVLGRELLDEMLGKQAVSPLIPMSLLLGRYTGWFLSVLKRRDARLLELTGKPSWEAVLAAGLSDATRELRARLGDDVERWTWGRVHRLKLRHPLGMVKPLNLIFDGPEVPIGGDTDTPLQTAHLPHKPYGVDAWAPSWRTIADLSDLTKSVSIFPGGQSGHPRTPHYLDQFPLWLEGEYHPHWLDKSAVAANAEDTLILRPPTT